MKETLDRILKRLKKWFILLILIPVLAGGAAYLFQKKGPSSYTANAEIQLANLDKQYSKPIYSDLEAAKIYLTSPDFIKNLKDTDSDINTDDIQSKLTFVNKPAKVIGLSYTGKKQKEAKNTLKQIVNQYIKESNKERDTTEKYYNDSKAAINSQSDLTKGDYDIKIQSLEKAKVLKEVQIDTVQESAKTKTVFGFLIGLMISFMILLLPEVFRK